MQGNKADMAYVFGSSIPEISLTETEINGISDVISCLV